MKRNGLKYPFLLLGFSRHLSLCTRDTCGERGAGPEVDLGAKDFTVDAKIVAAKIRETISQGNSE